MECGKYKELLQLYHDNELEKGTESVLFAHLSVCGECRDYFRNINLISANLAVEDFPDELDDRILYSVKEKTAKRKGRFLGSQLFPAFSYAAAVLLLIISVILFLRSDRFKSEIEYANREIHTQNRTIELLYNSLPPAEVSADVNKKNNIIIKANL